MKAIQGLTHASFLNTKAGTPAVMKANVEDDGCDKIAGLFRTRWFSGT